MKLFVAVVMLIAVDLAVIFEGVVASMVLAETALPELIEKVPRAENDIGKQMLTHHLPPTNVVKLFHKNSRLKFHQIFGANKTTLKEFWSGLFRTEEGKKFKDLHPTLKEKEPEQLQTSIPIIVHEDAAPYSKKSPSTSCSGAH